MKNLGKFKSPVGRVKPAPLELSRCRDTDLKQEKIVER
jgi:hypothetical protein